jgi:hypothetical protein
MSTAVPGPADAERYRTPIPRNRMQETQHAGLAEDAPSITG